MCLFCIKQATRTKLRQTTATNLKHYCRAQTAYNYRTETYSYRAKAYCCRAQTAYNYTTETYHYRAQTVYNYRNETYHYRAQTTYNCRTTTFQYRPEKSLYVLLWCWSQRGELLAKIEKAVSLTKLGFLGSTDIQLYDTGWKKILKKTQEEEEAVWLLAPGDNWLEHGHGDQCQTHFGVTLKVSSCHI